MITQKPKEVNFDALSKIMDEYSKGMMKIIIQLEKDIKELQGKENLTSDEIKELEYAKLDLSEMKIAYDTKSIAFQRYLVRVYETDMRKNAELEDFLKNHKAIAQKAISYSKHFRLPNNMKNHLKEILQQNIIFANNVPLQARVDYYLALKREIEICENFLSVGKR